MEEKKMSFAYDPIKEKISGDSNEDRENPLLLYAEEMGKDFEKKIAIENEVSRKQFEQVAKDMTFSPKENPHHRVVMNGIDVTAQFAYFQVGGFNRTLETEIVEKNYQECINNLPGGLNHFYQGFSQQHADPTVPIRGAYFSQETFERHPKIVAGGYNLYVSQDGKITSYVVTRMGNSMTRLGKTRENMRLPGHIITEMKLCESENSIHTEIETIHASNAFLAKFVSPTCQPGQMDFEDSEIIQAYVDELHNIRNLLEQSTQLDPQELSMLIDTLDAFVWNPFLSEQTQTIAQKLSDACKARFPERTVFDPENPHNFKVEGNYFSQKIDVADLSQKFAKFQVIASQDVALALALALYNIQQELNTVKNSKEAKEKYGASGLPKRMQKIQGILNDPKMTPIAKLASIQQTAAEKIETGKYGSKIVEKHYRKIKELAEKVLKGAQLPQVEQMVLERREPKHTSTVGPASLVCNDLSREFLKQFSKGKPSWWKPYSRLKVEASDPLRPGIPKEHYLDSPDYDIYRALNDSSTPTHMERLQAAYALCLKRASAPGVDSAVYVQFAEQIEKVVHEKAAEILAQEVVDRANVKNDILLALATGELEERLHEVKSDNYPLLTQLAEMKSEKDITAFMQKNAVGLAKEFQNLPKKLSPEAKAARALFRTPGVSKKIQEMVKSYEKGVYPNITALAADPNFHCTQFGSAVFQEEWAKFCEKEGIPFDKVVSGELAAMLKDTGDQKYLNLTQLVAICQGNITRDSYPINFKQIKEEFDVLSAATQKEQKVNPAAQLFEEKNTLDCCGKKLAA